MTNNGYESYAAKKMNLEQMLGRLQTLKETDNLDIDISKYVEDLIMTIKQMNRFSYLVLYFWVF